MKSYFSFFILGLKRVLHGSVEFSTFITGPIVIVAWVIFGGAAIQLIFMDTPLMPMVMTAIALIVILLHSLWWYTLDYPAHAHAETDRQILALTDNQIYEVYNASWREFVALHRDITANPAGAHDAVLMRASESRTALREVCDMIEAVKPHMATSREEYISARADVDRQHCPPS